jgi:hypothetical protein
MAISHSSIAPAGPRRYSRRLVLTGALAVGALLGSCAQLPFGSRDAAPALTGRLVAVGVAGAGAISPVGAFHTGGPIKDKPEFAAFTQVGMVLDPDRVLVTSSSNFGAPKALADRATGSVLSLDPRADKPLVVPTTFAVADGQAKALDGRLILYTAQSPAFLNKIYNPGAVTADLPPISGPTAISINNGFGRPWFANMPAGPTGAGTETVTDPDGRPLAGAPSKVAGGVFAGDRANRAQQLIPGSLTSGAVGTALMGKSSDGSGRAVFAVVTADGAVLQAHVEHGLDGLAPAGTIAALGDATPPLRAGVAFNWAPDQILFIADPRANAIAALKLVADGRVFRLEATRKLTPAGLSTPVDVAPAVPEVANPGFSSNTTLAGDSDLYVANRGNGTIMRLRQDGTVVAVRQVTLPGVGALGADRLNGIAVSPDAARIWVTIRGELPEFPGLEGAVVELPAFGAPGAR